MKKLNQIKIGQKAKIKKINIKDKKTKIHLLDMGLTQNTIVIIKKIAPMGDPIDIKLRDYELCLSKSDLSQIEVEEIKL